MARDRALTTADLQRPVWEARMPVCHTIAAAHTTAGVLAIKNNIMHTAHAQKKQSYELEQASVHTRMHADWRARTREDRRARTARACAASPPCACPRTTAAAGRPGCRSSPAPPRRPRQLKQDVRQAHQHRQHPADAVRVAAPLPLGCPEARASALACKPRLAGQRCGGTLAQHGRNLPCTGSSAP